MNRSRVFCAGEIATSYALQYPEGHEDKVSILRVGQLLYAYKSISGNGIGIAVLAPDEGTDYRWNEKIPNWAADDIQRAIEQAQNKAGKYYIPIDVTQQLSAPNLSNIQGLRGKIAAGKILNLEKA